MTRWHVVGGTYIDEVYRLESEIAHEVSLTATTREHTTGGPGACLALALARLGSHVTLTTALGDREDSVDAMALFEREGIEVGGERHSGPLDRSVTLVTPSLKSVTATHRVLPRLAPGPERLIAVPSDTVVVCSPTLLSSLGSIPAGLRLALVPHLPQCHELLTMRSEKRAALLAATDLIVVNEHEHRVLAPLPGIEEVPWVAVTRGGDGSTLHSRGRSWDQRAFHDPERPPLNPNGAGEAFTAALLTALASGASPRRALGTASVYAGRHVSGPASLSFPRSDLIDSTAPSYSETEHAYG
ncbi:carbohydrate kinase family protein [Nocardiopsis alba]|uniref:carbohydrate kinase family protein n=1 Tax=Nocardiopsis alba TaxID=53437 RepID=UPI00366ACAE6